MKAKKRESALLYPEISYLIQGCAFEIRKQYGPGQKEVIYHRLFHEKLKKAKLKFEKEKKINIYSQDSGTIIGTYQPDIVVEGKIVIELKSALVTTILDEKQLYFYLRNSEYELGYLINFSTPQLYMKRIVYGNHRKPHLKFGIDSLSNSL